MSYYQIGLETKVKKVPVDIYTLGHMAWGGALAAMGVPFWVVVGLGVGFELLEQSMKEHFPGMFPEPIQDSIAGQVTDVGAVIVGWGIVRYAMG